MFLRKLYMQQKHVFMHQQSPPFKIFFLTTMVGECAREKSMKNYDVFCATNGIWMTHFRNFPTNLSTKEAPMGIAPRQHSLSGKGKPADEKKGRQTR